MIHWLTWYIASSLLGWLAFPIAYRLMPWIKDRGYSISRILGLLVWGYSFWLLASLGILPFDGGGLLIAILLLVLLSLGALAGITKDEIKSWLSSQSRLIISVELLFLTCFGLYAIVRAANPEALGTEKPMELAFINAILRSRTFPPHDPWLSGYAISYYYFGYVLVAMLAKFTSSAGSIAFNLGGVLIFALSACGSYGLVFNILHAAKKHQQLSGRLDDARYTTTALWGPLYLLIVSNLEGALHILHSRGIFWQRDASGNLVSPFWKWLDIIDLNVAPDEPFNWVPNRFWWWWRASRVLQDYDLQGNSKEIIDEFPFFSFLLADLHPHVLAIPFAFLALSLALNILLNQRSGPGNPFHLKLQRAWLTWVSIPLLVIGLIVLIKGALSVRIPLFAAGLLITICGAALFWLFIRPSEDEQDRFSKSAGPEFTFSLDISPGLLILSAISIGGMAFLNTWDFPVYLFVFAASYALAKFMNKQCTLFEAGSGFIKIAAIIGFLGILFYLPFYIGFSSQAGGILPNLIYVTRGAHFWVMFGPLLVPILLFMTYLKIQYHDAKPFLRFLALSLVILLILWILSISLGGLISFIPERGQQYLGSLGGQDPNQLLRTAVQRRILAPGTWITLLIMLGLVLTLGLRIYSKNRISHPPDQAVDGNGILSLMNVYFGRAEVFYLLLVLTGLMLVLVPEFFYLLDMFGWRMNTIFKFYFQAWLIWSIAAALGTVFLDKNLSGIWRSVMRTVFALTLLASLVYPFLSLWSKTNGFSPPEWTLNSAFYFSRSSPEESAAIEWLRKAPFGVLAEAVPAAGGSYSEYARVSTLSGLPALLGWVGHENQWRGGGQAQGTRQSDLARIYCSRDWEETRLILEQYKIRYVFLGNLERRTYAPGTDFCPSGLIESKFYGNMSKVFEAGQIVIFENPDTNQNANYTN